MLAGAVARHSLRLPGPYCLSDRILLMNKTLLITVSSTLLVTASLAQRPSPGGTLKRARHLFGQIDTNGDGSLSAAEASRTKIPTRDFVSSDANRDRKLSGDEFIMFYRQLLVKGGKPVDATLQAEVTRIQAARRAATPKGTTPTVTPAPAVPVVKAPAAGGSETKPQEPAPEIKPKAMTDEERAQAVRDAKTQERVDAARDQKRAEDAQRAANVRAQKAADEEAARIAAARDQKQADDAVRAAKARAQKEADDAARAAAVRKQLAADAEAARIAAARAQATREAADRAAEARRQQERIEKARAARKHKDEFDKHVKGDSGQHPVAKGPGERAAGYVKRLADAGRLTPAQARDFYAVLKAKAGSAGQGADAKEIRAAHKRAKARLSDAVRAGHLTAEEGRVLSGALDQRAQNALGDDQDGKTESADHGQPIDAHGKDSIKGKGVRGARGASGEVGAGRTTQPKGAGVRPVGKGKKAAARDH